MKGALLKRIRAACCWLLMVGLPVVAGCATESLPSPDSIDACYRERSRAIQRKPALECLTTLDGRCVPLAPIFEHCAALWPQCVLFP